MYERLLELFGFGLCHQLPERSFFGGGVQVPVCARDTGIYVGMLFALVLIALLEPHRPTGLPSVGVSALLGAFVLAMAADGVTSYAGWRETTNEIRLVTGLLAGYAMGAIAAPLLNDQLWQTASRRRVLGTRRVLAIWLLSLPLAYASVMLGPRLLGAALPLAVAVAILATLTSVNLIIVTLVPQFERRALRIADAWFPILIALLLAWLEILASAALKAALGS